VRHGEEFLYSGNELDAMATASNYYRWITDQFAPFLGPRVIEVGAGIGTVASLLLERPAVRRLIAIEPAANTFPILADRFRGDSRVEVIQGVLGEVPVPEAVNTVIAVNVLEHVRDDEGFVRAAQEAVMPDGHLLLFVPAMPAIYGALDDSFGHFRRYTKESLGSILRACGWDVVRLSYANLPGVVAWLMASKVLRKRTIGRASVRVYDRLVFPLVSRLEAKWEPFIGQSLLAVARNPRSPVSQSLRS
jgi:SAM-dependent methyltransferase